MECNRNEFYLLKYISSPNEFASNKDELLCLISGMGIKLKFKFNNSNPIQEIIDELDYSYEFGESAAI